MSSFVVINGVVPCDFTLKVRQESRPDKSGRGESGFFYYKFLVPTSVLVGIDPYVLRWSATLKYDIGLTARYACQRVRIILYVLVHFI